MADLGQIAQAIESLTAQVRHLTTQNDALGTALTAAQTAASQAQAAATAAQAALAQSNADPRPRNASPASRNSGSVLTRDWSKSVKSPKPLKGRDDFETFKFAWLTWISTQDPQLPTLLEAAEKKTVAIDYNIDLSEPEKETAVILYGVLVSHVEANSSAYGLLRKTPNKNGFEAWRILVQEYQPRTWNKHHEWLRALNSPTFPKREADFSVALQEWEAEICEYEADSGKILRAA